MDRLKPPTFHRPKAAVGKVQDLSKSLAYQKLKIQHLSGKSQKWPLQQRLSLLEMLLELPERLRPLLTSR
jgi:hypothetical protein